MEPMKKHYHLVSGQILVASGGVGDDKAEVLPVRCDAVMASESQNIPAYMLVRAHETLQKTLRQRIDDLSVHFIDLTINSISYLGHMTDDEFNAPAPTPAGLAEESK